MSELMSAMNLAICSISLGVTYPGMSSVDALRKGTLGLSLCSSPSILKHSMLFLLSTPVMALLRFEFQNLRSNLIPPPDFRLISENSFSSFWLKFPLVSRQNLRILFFPSTYLQYSLILSS